MLIIHTSDLHLNPDKPETIQALECILDTCKNNSADILTIGGDLFDSARDVETLRPQLRKIFSGNDFRIISIPGNHDIDAYTRNLDFGEDFKMVTGEPFEIIPCDGVSMVALPFREQMSEDLITQLIDAVDPERLNILLLHCTLDISFETLDFGEEDKKSYFPVTSSMLSQLGFKYILAGHLHKEYYHKEMSGGTKFVYPGSPLSLTWKELGQRQVALLDTEAGIIKPILLSTNFHDKESFFIKPGEEREVLSQIQKWIDDYTDKSCELMVEVSGFGEMDEVEFGETLIKISRGSLVENHYRNVENVLEHILFKRFKEKFNEKDDISRKEAIERRVIEVMSELLAERKIR